MRILDSYIRSNIIKTICLVALCVLCLDSFFRVIAESKYVTKYDGYDYIDVVQFIFLSLPEKIVELLPSMVLLGCLLGMGGLVSSNELTAIRTFGYSVSKIVIASMSAGLIFCLMMLFFMQFVTPRSELMAREFWLKEVGRSIPNTQKNYWTKIESDNTNVFIHIEEMNAEGKILGVTAMTVSGTELRQKLEAQSAHYENEKWVLNNVKKYSFSNESVDKQSYDRLIMHNFLPADIYKRAKINPRTLSLTDLFEYAHYLRSHNLDYDAYDRALWNKVAKIFSILVMILVTMPFVFSDKRSGNAGTRLLIGIVVGMTYHILSQVIISLGQIYQWNALMSAFAPLLVFMVAGIVLLRRV